MTPEGELKKDIIDLIKADGWSYRNIQLKGIRGRKNSAAGMPDLLLCKNGRVKFWEIKTPKGTLSDSQKKFMKDFETADVSVIRSIDDAREQLSIDLE